MKIVFFGSSHFGLPSLKALLDNGYQVSCVVTQPDKRKGRWLALAKTQIKSFAEEAKIQIFQPENINAQESSDFLQAFNADLFIVIAYGQILSEDILQIPRIFPLNVHASLLPKYRGAAPINWAIIRGEINTGVSVMKMVQQMDAGAVIMQKSIGIDFCDTAATLEDKLSILGKSSLLETLEMIKGKSYAFVEQDQGRVSYAPKLKKNDGLINWGKPAEEIYNFIRGCNPWPGAFTYYHGETFKIHQVNLLQEDIQVSGQSQGGCGEILAVTKTEIIVATGAGKIVIQELQPQGKRRMKTDEFIAGHHLKATEAFK